jgi:hypothetical protein
VLSLSQACQWNWPGHTLSLAAAQIKAEGAEAGRSNCWPSNNNRTTGGRTQEALHSHRPSRAGPPPSEHPTGLHLHFHRFSQISPHSRGCPDTLLPATLYYPSTSITLACAHASAPASGAHLNPTVHYACLALPCLALPCLALPCLALPCLALPCLALPCLALPCLALPCLALPCLALPCLALPCLALPCLALPCLALPCLALPCLALPCLALPCLALPCLALPCLASLQHTHSSLFAFVSAQAYQRPAAFDPGAAALCRALTCASTLTRLIVLCVACTLSMQLPSLCPVLLRHPHTGAFWGPHLHVGCSCHGRMPSLPPATPGHTLNAWPHSTCRIKNVGGWFRTWRQAPELQAHLQGCTALFARGTWEALWWHHVRTFKPGLWWHHVRTFKPGKQPALPPFCSTYWLSGASKSLALGRAACYWHTACCHTALSFLPVVVQHAKPQNALYLSPLALREQAVVSAQVWSCKPGIIVVAFPAVTGTASTPRAHHW